MMFDELSIYVCVWLNEAYHLTSCITEMFSNALLLLRVIIYNSILMGSWFVVP